jgi:hypothetical protein
MAYGQRFNVSHKGTLVNGSQVQARVVVIVAFGQEKIS